MSQIVKAAGQVIKLPDTPRQTIEKGLAIADQVRGLVKGLGRDEMLALWQWLYMDTVNAVKEEKMSFKDRKDAAMTLATCTEKALLLSGQPTQIVAGIHEHRHNLADIAGKLARVSKLIEKPEVIDAEVVYVKPVPPAPAKESA